jgi:hypothetical protein
VISISPLSAQTSTTTYVIDFEGLAEGAIISEVNCGAGIDCPDGDIPGSIKVRGVNPSLSGNPNAAMIFDAECDGGCTGGDDDLFFPGHGNTLIISEDLDSGEPNDGDVLNSFLEFDFNGFPGVVTIESIDVGDIEFAENEDGAFVHFHEGECQGHFLPAGDEIELPNTGNNEIETVEVGVSAIGPDVECLHVHLNGSGTIDNIKFSTDIKTAIDIEKATNGQDADEPTGPTIPVGDPVNWSYVVTNIGDVPLSNVSVDDDQGVVVTCPQDTLAVGESMTCTASDTAQAGQYANLGTACGLSDAGTEVCDEDPSHYFGEAPGNEGCTPGYWKQKQHIGSWEGYTTGQSFSSVFVDVITVRSGGKTTITDPTLLEALQANGGDINALARHAVAALLNSSSSGVDYEFSEQDVIVKVSAAIPDGDVEGVKNILAAANEAGCPLGRNPGDN